MEIGPGPISLSYTPAMQARAATSLALLAGALACNGPAADNGFASSQPGPTSTPAGSSTGTSEASSSGGAGSAASAEDSGAGTTEPLRDLGGEPDFGPDKPLGCKGKIDFLFLISRAGQMQTEQKQLLASFPGFIDTIETMFPDFDTHIMVANPEGTWPGWACEQDCKFNACSSEVQDYVCGPASYELVTHCDEVLGAGLLFNAGPDATNSPCSLAGGHRYMVTRDEPDPLAAFECIARVGTYGYSPPFGDALIAALSPYLSVGECNKGFLRDDALLFITFISDTVDEESKTTPADWYKAIMKAKHGDPGAVITLFMTPQYVPNPPPGCTYDDDDKDKERLRELITMFPYHVEGDTCAPTYAPYFAAAAELVGEACASFAPQ